VRGRGILGSSDQIEEEHDQGEGYRSGDRPQQPPGGVVLVFLVWWMSPTPQRRSRTTRVPYPSPSEALRRTKTVPARGPPRVQFSPSSSSTMTTPSRARTSLTSNSLPGVRPCSSK